MLDIVDLSRLQFALTVLYHFLFVPLTLGLSFMLVIMETIYVSTGKEIYRDMTKFWGKLFGINFALGVTTGITMEFQFGTNWSFYSHYVGDIFGAPLAIEALLAFFLESTFAGLFFFGWNRLSKAKHLMSTYLIAIGSNLSAMWILVANGWMQNPVGAHFNFETMRMEMTNFLDLWFNPVSQNKFLHTLTASYVLAACFVLGISSFYILKKRDLAFAKRSFAIASVFGLISIIGAFIMGDQSGYDIGKVQPTKLAAMEAEWNTEPAPASWNIFAISNEKERKNDFAISVPWIGGLIATRSLDEQIQGMNELIEINKQRIRNGMQAYALLNQLRAEKSQTGKIDPKTKAKFSQVSGDLGYGLLLKEYAPDVTNANEDQIAQAARNSVPKVMPNFITFRIMIGLGGLIVLLIFFAFIVTIRKKIGQGHRWLYLALLWGLPLPWLAIESGWFLAEFGRQPWAVYEILPVGVAASYLKAEDLWLSIGLMCGLYSLFMIIESYLMVKFTRLGPSCLKTGRYHFEQSANK